MRPTYHDIDFPFNESDLLNNFSRQSYLHVLKVDSKYGPKPTKTGIKDIEVSIVNHTDRRGRGVI